MTLLPEVVTEQEKMSITEPVMAVVDEFGQETPITELDIRRSLKQLTEVNSEKNNQVSYDQLMERVYAARAIA